ncbi:branched-chain amino acid aminotransferase II [Calocera cornea HHB12733]|uniref:Branched-chain-amino-acid aminotransferase n=1 Tax=Calocera cornea HHB12733 TaxID=1353952 RepID=A0A165HTK8_9BASI|nr:branched-chain amino acid aminotransferase II [Calocera cornea HHB12733]
MQTSVSRALRSTVCRRVGVATLTKATRRTLSLSTFARSSPRTGAVAVQSARRQYATTVPDPSTLPGLDASKLKVTPNPDLKTPPPSDQLTFGTTFTDHMLTIPWNSATGWGEPHIKPFGDIPMHPGSMGIHYAISAFEGMKAYRDASGRVTLFRPDKNMARLNRSVARITMPTFDGAEMITLIKELVKLDAHWIPTEPGHSLYVRPIMLGTQPTLYVGPTNEALLYVICSPVGPYYKTAIKPVALLGTDMYTRAAPGGTGGYKVAANYAPAIVPQLEAEAAGYDQNLWLLGPEHVLTEVGSMNLFLVLKTKDGKTELVTPDLADIILPGVTRDSILALARAHASGEAKIAGLPADLVVSERKITMAEVKEAAAEGRLLEVFGAGTAAVVSPVGRIGWEGKDIVVDCGKEGAGPVTRTMLREIEGRQYGRIPSEWAVVVQEGTE